MVLLAVLLLLVVVARTKRQRQPRWLGNSHAHYDEFAMSSRGKNSSSSNGTCPYAADAVETSTLLGIDPSERLRVALYSKVIVPVQLVWLVALPFGLFATWLQMRAKPRYRIDVAVPGAVLGR